MERRGPDGSDYVDMGCPLAYCFVARKETLQLGSSNGVPGPIGYRAKMFMKIVERSNDSFTQSISLLSLKPGEEEIKRKGWWRF